MSRGGIKSPEHRAKLVAAGKRAYAKRRKTSHDLSSGPGQSPAAWLPTQAHVGDCQYLDDGADEILIRAVHNRLVYAHSLTGHRVPAFSDIVTRTLAAATLANCTVNEKTRTLTKRVRKSGDPRSMPTGALKSTGHKPPVISVGRSLVDIVAEARLTGHRTGRPLTDVVRELFPT